MSLSLETATKVALAALDAGGREGIGYLTVVVTDPGGTIRVALRADAAGLFGVDIALAKARTALGFNMSSQKIAQILAGNPAGCAGLVGATDGRFLPIGGGIVVQDAEANLVGAVAVAGSSPENDERFATEGARAAGLIVPA
jgi:uncharacterized protein GlcG (DUF336 family)